MNESFWRIMAKQGDEDEYEVVSSEWRVIISLKAYCDMILAAQECPVEVGGRHKVEIRKEEKVFYISEVWIPPQSCSAMGFRMTGDDENEVMMEDEANIEGFDWDEFRHGFWHSHGGGFAILSGTDLRSTEDHMNYLQEDWIKEGYPFRDEEFQVEFVVNRRGEISARFSLAVPAIHSAPFAESQVELEDDFTRDDVLKYFDENRDRIHDWVYDRVKVGIRDDMPSMKLWDFVKNRSLRDFTSKDDGWRQ